MRYMRSKLVIIWFVAVFSISSTTNAEFVVDNFGFTDSSVSFQISGALVGAVPEDGLVGLAFANTSAADPGFVTTSDFEFASSISWTGTQSVVSALTGSPLFGDYFVINFTEDLALGEDLSGTFSANFSPGTFDVSEVDSINVIWGFATDFAGRTFHDADFLGGSFQTSFAVPEPSSGLVLAIAALFPLFRRRVAIG